MGEALQRGGAYQSKDGSWHNAMGEKIDPPKGMKGKGAPKAAKPADAPPAAPTAPSIKKLAAHLAGMGSLDAVQALMASDERVEEKDHVRAMYEARIAELE